MPFSIVGFYENIDPGGNLVSITVVADPTLHTEGDNAYLAALTNLIGAYAVGTKIRQCILKTPSLLRMFPYHVNPVQSENRDMYPKALVLNPENPIGLVEGEGLECEIADDGVTGTPQDQLCGVFLSDGPLIPYKGEIFTQRIGITGTPVKGKWTDLVITFDETLPVAEYAIVGMNLETTEDGLFRLIPVGGGPRPGGVAVTSIGADVPKQRFGKLGEWMRFRNTTPPTLQVCLLGTTTPTKGFIDLVRTGP